MSTRWRQWVVPCAPECGACRVVGRRGCPAACWQARHHTRPRETLPGTQGLPDPPTAPPALPCVQQLSPTHPQPARSRSSCGPPSASYAHTHTHTQHQPLTTHPQPRTHAVVVDQLGRPPRRALLAKASHQQLGHCRGAGESVRPRLGAKVQGRGQRLRHVRVHAQRA